MTTDRRRRPTGGLSATEWRLVLITVLSSSYAAAWTWLFVPSARDVDLEPRHARAAEGAGVVATVGRHPPAVFYDRMPPAERPEFVLPAGFRLASSATDPEPRIAMRTRRVVTRRPMRIRTRSS